MQSTPLTNLQLELLRVFAREVSENDVLAIRKMLADYFAEKAINLADEAWDKNGWTAEDRGGCLLRIVVMNDRDLR